MTKLFLRALFFLIPFLYSIYVSAQSKSQKDCSTTCFSSEVVSAEKISGTCTSYELKVSYSGACAHALSHFSVAVPCGEIAEVWNSQNFAQEIGTDPTTGLRGFKINNTANFGEGSLQYFTVKFNICTSGEDCAEQMSCWQPIVAYKAATCVNYETLEVSCRSLKASLEKKDASCFNANDGSLSVVIEEGQEPYTFLWSDNTTGESISNLAAGTYTVIVRDGSGAEVTLEETIGQPNEISLSGTSLPASCNGVPDGSIDLTIAGGKSPYSIEWDHGAKTEDLQNVSSGQYTVTVKDANHCAVARRFTIGSNSRMDIAGSHVKPDCNDSNGSIDISVTGGTSPYTFTWSDNVGTEDRDKIGAGFYKVVVTDDTGCTEEAAFLLKEDNSLKLEGISAPANCNDDESGSVDLTITGGTAPYTIDWSNETAEEDLVDVASGYYTVTVTDEKGCMATEGFGVSKSTFQVPRIVKQPGCHDENNGSITLLEPIGGTGPFTYLWSRDNETGTALTNLGAGIYSVTITDATGCSRTLTSTIKNPSEILASATVSNQQCHAEGAFSIDLGVSGGTAPYSFDWSNGSTDEDISDVDSGTYTVIVTDDHGCTVTKEITLEGESASWSCLISEPLTAPVCGSDNNTLSTPVTDADSYLWTVESTDGTWSITGADTPSIGFVAGSENSTATFTLTIVKDGCTKTCSYSVSSCTPQDSGEGSDPGEEEPGDEDQPEDDPNGENPDEDGENGEGSQTCEECFQSVAKVVDISGACRTYEMQVATNGLCRHDLSHWTLAIPCGTISNYSNSEGWSMEFGKDPTTGLYGLKVDGINRFGKEADWFTVRFTICENDACGLSSWSPIIAYKAGQCIGTETVVISVDPSAMGRVSVYPNPFQEKLRFEWAANDSDVYLQIIDQYGNILSTVTSPSGRSEGYYITLESSMLPRGMYYYRLTVDGNTYHGKLSKR